MNKSVLITGSSKGLGEGLAYYFSERGFNVIIHGRDKKGLKRVREKVLNGMHDCVEVVGDINTTETLDELEEVSRQEDVVLLINNAGIGCPDLPFEDITDKNVDDIIGTNLVGPIKLALRVYRIFAKKQSGTIININSLCGLELHHKRAIYSGSKWGLRGFSDVLKLESMENGVRIVDVYIGRTRTKPEFTYGMTVEYVCQKLFDYYESGTGGELILDNRPEKYKKAKRM